MSAAVADRTGPRSRAPGGAVGDALAPRRAPYHRPEAQPDEAPRQEVQDREAVQPGEEAERPQQPDPGHDGEALEGPHAGTRLDALGTHGCFWFAWSRFHRETGVYAGAEARETASG